VNVLVHGVVILGTFEWGKKMEREAVDLKQKYPGLGMIMGRENLRKHERSVLHVISVWIKNEDAVEKLPIETVLRPIVEFFDHAPGLQEDDTKKIVDERQIREHLTDEGVRTDLEPCIIKVIQSLRYAREELYQLSRADIKRLESAIVRVREHFHVKIPSPARLAPEIDGNLKGVVRRL